jgi:hypothetical protein
MKASWPKSAFFNSNNIIPYLKSCSPVAVGGLQFSIPANKDYRDKNLHNLILIPAVIFVDTHNTDFPSQFIMINHSSESNQHIVKGHKLISEMHLIFFLFQAHV